MAEAITLDRALILRALDAAPPADLVEAYQRRIIGTRRGRKTVLRPCPKCGALCGARELRYQHRCAAA